jgi:RNA-directed DNA polymerase
MRGWSNYFKHAVAKHTMSSPRKLRVAQGDPHRRRWKDVRRHHAGCNGRWVRPSADGVELFNLAKVPITRYWYRGAQIPNPGTLVNSA